MSTYQRKPVRRLEVLAGLRVISLLHKRATVLETDYFAQWVEKQLTSSSRQIEKALDVRSLDLDVTIEKFKESLEKKKMKGDKMSGRVVKFAAGSENCAAGRRMGLRSSKRQAAAAPYIVTRRQQKLQLSALDPDQHGIPSGVRPTEFIRYRKCKYLSDVDSHRRFLAKALNRCVLNNLACILHNIVAGHRSCDVPGLLTLQAMLVTESTTDLHVTPLRLFCVADPPFFSSSIFQQPPTHMETRLEMALLQKSLVLGTSLTRLILVSSASDNLLKVMSECCPNITQLDISHSYVSCRGLNYLCGLREEPNKRRQLSRACKNKAFSSAGQHMSQNANIWRKTGQGCSKLQTFTAHRLLSIVWPSAKQITPPTHHMFMLGSRTRYLNCVSVPEDCGFVSLVAHLPRLRVFLTSMGARVLQAFSRRWPRRKLPSLEIASEMRMDWHGMESLRKIAPNLRVLVAKSKDDRWLRLAAECRMLADVRLREIDMQTPAILTDTLLSPAMGANLVRLDLRELTYFKYSWLRAIRANCAQIVDLRLTVILMSTISALYQVDIEKDYVLEASIRTDPKLGQLESFRLSGPFGLDVAKYLLRGAGRLTSLWLGVDWLDPSLCNSQPVGRRDLLGLDYMEELAESNPNIYAGVTELHLGARYRRGRNLLDRQFAFHVLARFKNLRHLGNFRHWNLNSEERSAIVGLARDSNRALTFDEDLYAPTGGANGADCAAGADITRCYIDADRHALACCDRNWAGATVSQAGSYMGFFSELIEGLVPDPYLEDVAVSDSDDSIHDDDDFDDDDSDLEDELDNEDGGNQCSIM